MQTLSAVESPVHRKQILESRIVESRFASDDADLKSYLLKDWTDHELIALLADSDRGIVRSAAIALGLIGRIESSGSLSLLLHHEDFFLVTTVENSLWSIWFRASTPTNTRRLKQAVQLIQSEEFESAADMIRAVLTEDPRFAEAHNQQAVLYYMTGQFEQSLLACFRARAQNPCHFGAAAGIGHNLLRLGRYEAAIDAYRRSLQLHPRLAGIRQALRQARTLSQSGIADTY